MSGHSKWAKLKHTKPATDEKKSRGFSRHSNLITIAAKQGGNPDPKLNPFLKEAIEKARQINMPRENIERAIKRGLGLIPGVIFEELSLEAYGPAGVALVIQIATDNKNRSIPEIRKIISDSGGSMANPGSVLWLFKEMGKIIVFETSWLEEPGVELKIIELGAEEVVKEKSEVFIFCHKDDLKKIEELLKEKGVPYEASIELVPENIIAIKNPGDKTKITKLLGNLESREDMNAIFHNADLED
ncbi:MAG: hypothetical protein A2391_01055 [Candidatus Brennerbacteria bacterium RIFOXYB1_FULL_41_13]|uniref:Probable transcriptional regulatory protein A2570_00920 n=1 Tax=Candidatus Brennerbacteria bacterium RIFOXYD1_FULL_41_16 TaxID=1797529 RepID=A0A1G1XKX1_9BACT|nr:MAG: hypothetical protein A2391_01055 [Candidatus Brennerbacteria bacterium RIFOXYB1_FULL_41_13]OGY40679.1 MAG: hypothetical protein A2570_00920 [Candidatus Brennerbacteria bacterium RIFOXYD1_FULL_41_16]